MEIKITANFSTKEEQLIETVKETIEKVELGIVRALQISEKPLRLWARFK